MKHLKKFNESSHEIDMQDIENFLLPLKDLGVKTSIRKDWVDSSKGYKSSSQNPILGSIERYYMETYHVAEDFEESLEVLLEIKTLLDRLKDCGDVTYQKVNMKSEYSKYKIESYISVETKNHYSIDTMSEAKNLLKKAGLDVIEYYPKEIYEGGKVPIDAIAINMKYDFNPHFDFGGQKMDKVYLEYKDKIIEILKDILKLSNNHFYHKKNIITFSI